MTKEKRKYITKPQKKLYYQKFDWASWFSSLDVRTLPQDVRMTWLEMIGLMWLSDERGYLTTAGKPSPDKVIASVLGISLETYQAHLTQLEEVGLFSRREEDGAIFSRRILRDTDLEEKRVAAGHLGGVASTVARDGHGYYGELKEEEKVAVNERVIQAAIQKANGAKG